MSWPFTIEPFQVQLKALEKAERRTGFAYFMEMGLGKTAVTLAEFFNLHDRKLVDVLVVICPNSLKTVWPQEGEKLGACAKFIVWPYIEDFTTPAVITMNYEAVITTRGRQYLQNVMSRHRVMLVLDESIQIKNHKAQRTKHLIALAQMAKYRRILSGAPVVQGPHDLWAQLRFINVLPQYLNNYFLFRNTFCKMGGYLAKQVVGAQNEEVLYKIVDSNGFRARKRDWLDLPEKLYTVREVEMTPQQKKHYNELRIDLFTKVLEDEIEAPMMITAMMKMQQVASGFILNAKGEAIEIPGGNPKLDAVKEVMEETTGKVLIFCHFRHSVDVLMDGLAQYNPLFMMGGLSQSVIEGTKKAFNTGENSRVLILQTNTGKYGHTLLGSNQNPCSTTIYYENDYSLDARIQSEDRNHRMGMGRNPVTYVDILCSKLDRTIVAALQKKTDVAQAVVDNIRKG